MGYNILFQKNPNYPFIYLDILSPNYQTMELFTFYAPVLFIAMVEGD